MPKQVLQFQFRPADLYFCAVDFAQESLHLHELVRRMREWKIAPVRGVHGTVQKVDSMLTPTKELNSRLVMLLIRFSSCAPHTIQGRELFCCPFIASALRSVTSWFTFCEEIIMDNPSMIFMHRNDTMPSMHPFGLRPFAVLYRLRVSAAVDQNACRAFGRAAFPLWGASEVRGDKNQVVGS